jgi:D-inositol-3-phosphate glycosyltransferase
MRVAMVSEHASPLAALGGADAGGQNVHVAELATELGRRGHEVVVHTRRTDPSVPRRIPLAANVAVDHVEAGPPEPIPKDDLLPYMGAFAKGLARQWRSERPAIVHSHFWMSGRAALAAARPLGLPVVHTFHALDVVRRRYQGECHRSPSEWLETEQELVWRADRLIAQCSDEVFELARLDAPAGRITVAPSGVDVGHFTPDGPADGRRDGVPRLVCLARLVERKGVGDAIAALADLPGVELVVAGGPDPARLHHDPEVRRLQALVRELGVADRVDFRGRVSRQEAPRLLRSADAVVCVPWYEPFGIVPLEAMACGVPVIGSAVGGLIDTVVHGLTGLHVPPQRPDAIAAAARTLLDDARLRQELGQVGADRVRRLYTWPRTAEATLAAYRTVVGPAEAAARGQG